MSEEVTLPTTGRKSRFGAIGPYLALLAAILFFSGLFFKVDGLKWLGAFDFTTLGGSFGTIKDATSTFIGVGGVSAKAGFLFALSLVPTVMLALGILEIFTHYGAIRAAHRLLTPLLRPILGIPGRTGLALITDLQSTDAGAALTKELHDRGEITKKDVVIMGAWQYSGAGLINNYFSIGSALFASMTAPVVIPLVLMLVLKFVGAALVRIILNSVYRKDFNHEQ
ncbi:MULTISPECIES: nucleoside recognition domain-containing protein [Musicola]|uniref:Nucleoside recognition domain protein n=1 Tax=Musicola paradisiaca (strain Ech703) TaxID=579405 RepID=C6C9Y5_MUSP7|nr:MULTISPECIES: nucleoside recognition domain-containing protein [Musicola]ACS86407.1 nucleoside recognition domain protein [Musicola paradisiaca Ech703]